MHPDCAARFLSPEAWVQAPRDWPIHTQTEKRYDLTTGEGARVWHECVAVATSLLRHRTLSSLPVIAEPTAPRYGLPTLITPRLGQGTFRVAVTEAYGKGCAITDEHSLPALEAAHLIGGWKLVGVCGKISPMVGATIHITATTSGGQLLLKINLWVSIYSGIITTSILAESVSALTSPNIGLQPTPGSLVSRIASRLDKLVQHDDGVVGILQCLLVHC